MSLFQVDEDEDELPDVLVMRAEIGAESPLWDAAGDLVWLDSLPLPPQLQEELAEWADIAWERSDPAILREGKRLYGEVVQALRGRCRVVWDHSDH